MLQTEAAKQRLAQEQSRVSKLTVDLATAEARIAAEHLQAQQQQVRRVVLSPVCLVNF